MNKSSHRPFCVQEGKIQASLLLKSLHSGDQEISKQAARRFQRLPEFKEFSLEEIVQIDIKRKIALAVIAMEKGFKSWTELKCQIPFIKGGFLNQWFADYTQAKSYLLSNGGFLLPYKNQFFICDNDYIENLGIDPTNSDWTLIGYDWANPADNVAWKRLYREWMEIQEA